MKWTPSSATVARLNWIAVGANIGALTGAAKDGDVWTAIWCVGAVLMCGTLARLNEAVAIHG